MKNLFYYLLVISLVIVSCSDTEDSSSITEGLNLDNRESTFIQGVENIDGRLHFKDNEALRNYIHTLASDGEASESLESSDYSTSDETQETTGFRSQYPRFKSYELKLGFTSLRSIEESAFEYEEISEFIDQPYLKSVMNEKRAFSVGKRTYVYFNPDKVAVIINDESLVNRVFDSEGSIPNELNLRYELGGDVNYTFFEPYDDGEVPVDKPKVDILIHQEFNQDGSISLLNKSFVETNGTEACYVWTLPNGDIVQGEQVNGNFNGGDRLLLEIFDGCGGPNVCKEELELRSPPHCQTTGAGSIGNPGEWTSLGEYFTIEGTGCRFIPNFDFSGNLDTGVEWWQFELIDPSTGNVVLTSPSFNSNNTNQLANSLDNLFPGTLVRICIKYLRYTGACCGVYIIPECNTTCPELGTVHAVQEFELGNGRYQIAVEVWVETSGSFDWATPGEVGCRMLIRRWTKKWGKWKFRDSCAEIATMALRGNYTKSSCPVIEIDKESFRTDCDNDVQINHDDGGARKLPGALWGEFAIFTEGEWGYYNGPNGRLVLD